MNKESKSSEQTGNAESVTEHVPSIYDLYSLCKFVDNHKCLSKTQKLQILFVIGSPEKIPSDWLR